MTPRQARVALGGFFLLAIGVTTNALYLQGAVSSPTEKTAAAVRPESRHSAPKSTKAAKAPDKAPAPEKAPAAEKTAMADAPQSVPQGAPKSAPKSPQSVKVRMVRVATVGETRAEEA